jgi:hypothetical protein
MHWIPHLAACCLSRFLLGIYGGKQLKQRIGETAKTEICCSVHTHATT